MGRENVISALGLPGEFGLVLLLLALIFALAPYFSGHDFGVLKIPVLHPVARRRLRFVGPLVMLIAISAHLPLIRTSNASETPTGTALSIESRGAQLTARVGVAQLDEYNNAEIVFVVRDPDGEPILDLMDIGHTGSARQLMKLPQSVKLNGGSVPAGGCALSPTTIYNDGRGVYSLRVLTANVYGPCPWLAGEYGYSLEVATNNRNGIGIGTISIR